MKNLLVCLYLSVYLFVYSSQNLSFSSPTSTIDSSSAKKAASYEPYWRDPLFYKRRYGGLENVSNNGTSDNDDNDNISTACTTGSIVQNGDDKVNNSLFTSFLGHLVFTLFICIEVCAKVIEAAEIGLGRVDFGRCARCRVMFHLIQDYRSPTVLVIL